MSKGSFKKIIFSLFGVISVGLILGFLYGLGVSISNIFNHNYLYYQLYNLILLDLQSNITKYSIIFILIAFIIIALILFFKKMNPWITGSRITSIKKLYLSIFFIASIIILLGICYFYFVDIVAFLKVSPATEWLGNFTKSKQDTSFIFSAILGLVVLLFILFFAYSIWHRALENVLDNISKRMNSGIIKSLGIAVIGLVIFFNVFMFGYTRLNTPEGPNIILISIDTLRADHLGSYGYERDTSPNIDNIAEEGVLFENAFSQAPWTLPSMASIHTSLYPSENGVIDHGKKIDDSFLTIAEFLKNNSYKTLGVISMPFVNSKYGFSQGFDTFDEKHISGVNDVSSHLITAEAIDYITQNQKKKFFLWIHYFDPHGAYIPHKEFDYGSNYPGHLPKILEPGPLNFIPNKFDDSDIQYLKDIYDEEISYTDKNIGNLIETVDKLGLKDNTIIIITADHGEEFMERGGFGHRSLLYNELINVPLIIYTPFDNNLKGIRVKDNVEIRNIAKTIVDMIDIPNNPFSGQNLLSKTEASTNDSYIYSNVYKNDEVLKETVISKNHKLIKNYNDQIFELYDLKDDPDEKNNLFGSKQYGIQNLQTTLLTKLSEIKKNRSQKLQEVELKEEDVKKLKALGYLQ